MSESVADNQLRSFFERWNRLEEEKRTISDDLKDLFSEMKGCGFDTKAARAVFREQVGDKAAAEEFDAICDLYRASLNGPRARPAHARVEKIEKIPPHDAETGEIVEAPEQRETSQSQHEANGQATVRNSGVTAGETALIQAPVAQRIEQGASTSSVAGSTPAGCATRKPLRPHCQRPDQCGGYGAKHCYSCAKAAEVEAA